MKVCGEGMGAVIIPSAAPRHTCTKPRGSLMDAPLGAHTSRSLSGTPKSTDIPAALGVPERR